MVDLRSYTLSMGTRPRLAGMALVLGILPVLVAGCGDSSDSDPVAPAPTQATSGGSNENEPDENERGDDRSDEDGSGDNERDENEPDEHESDENGSDEP
jgi:hypothetical protein